MYPKFIILKNFDATINCKDIPLKLSISCHFGFGFQVIEQNLGFAGC